jgi:hypothetical protein
VRSHDAKKILNPAAASAVDRRIRRVIGEQTDQREDHEEKNEYTGDFASHDSEFKVQG